MAATLATFDFALPVELEADAPPEIRGTGPEIDSID